MDSYAVVSAVLVEFTISTQKALARESVQHAT
jgi:hypothetical protein